MARILIVADDSAVREALSSSLADEGCEIDYAAKGTQALKLAAQSMPDLVLLDADIPDMNGLDVCRHLRLDPLLAEVPIILIAETDHRDTELAGLDAGADDVLFKPVDTLYLLSRTRNILRLNRYRKLINERTTNDLARVERETSYESILAGWARALELRGVEPDGHIQRVLRMTLRLAHARNVPADHLSSIRWGVLLHDSGKCGVPDEILTKQLSLSGRERMTLRKHPEYAYDLFCCTEAMQAILEIPYCHHERWDGAGYPRGLKGAEIPLAARIFAAADAWDILTSAPPCGKGWSKTFARQQILEQAGKRFDPDVVETFDALLNSEDLTDAALPAVSDKEAVNAAQADARHPHWFTRFTVSSRGAKLYFLSSIVLISVIPSLAFFYMTTRGFIGNQIAWGMLIPLEVNVLLLMLLGYGVLAKYPAGVVRLRHWVEELAKGDIPVRIELSSDEDELAAIERCLREVVHQSRQRVHTLELQTESLLVAERQRVAIEGLGAACHHLGQPATSLSIALYMMRRANTSPEVTPLINQCQHAADAMSEILQKLRHIANYRNEPYLVTAESSPAAENKNILLL